LLRLGAARTVVDAADLAQQAVRLLGSTAEREVMATAAIEWQRENGGGVRRTLAAIREELATLY